MQSVKKAILAGVALLAMPADALADGNLNIFNWGNYTSPELIKKAASFSPVRRK